MIQTTNLAKNFFEDEMAGPIYIYGMGNPGYWVNYYMVRCNITFAGYIDKLADSSGSLLGWEKLPIWHPSALKNMPDDSLRIIIAVGDPDSAIADLHWYADEKKLLCLTPLYNDVIHGTKTYNINKLLGYFRKKCLNNKMPSIFSDGCNASYIYFCFDQDIPNSPTINMGIDPEDFLKFCKNPTKYLACKAEFSHWALDHSYKMVVGKIGDITIRFDHTNDPEKCINRWNVARKLVDTDNIVCIMEEWGDWRRKMTYDMMKEFCSLPYKHLMFTRHPICSPLPGLIQITKEECRFSSRDYAWENWFDLVGWLNGEFEI